MNKEDASRAASRAASGHRRMLHGRHVHEAVGTSVMRTARLRRVVIARAVGSPFLFNADVGDYIMDDSRWTWRDDDVPCGPEGYLALQPGARIGYFREFFANSDSLFRLVESEASWLTREVIVNGQVYMQPRMICYMADEPSFTYTYYKTKNHPIPYTPAVLHIKSQLEEALKTTFNCVLMNLYKDGEDYMEWHPDDEPLFGKNPTIASVSLGQRRAFDFRMAANPEIRFRYMLGGGDMLVMEGGVLQQNWEHAVIVGNGTDKARINMTFRMITDPEPMSDE